MTPPYYAVIFTSKQTENIEGYAEMALQIENLAIQQPGFLGMETAKQNIGITISYWQNLEAIKHWKNNSEHQLAQQKGKNLWYKWYKVRICKVTHHYDFWSNNN